MTNQSWVTWISRVQISVPPSLFFKMQFPENLEQVIIYTGVMLGSLQVCGSLYHHFGLAYSTLKTAKKMLIGTDQQGYELCSRYLQEFLTKE